MDTCDKFTAAVDGMPPGQVIAMRTPRGTFLGEGAAYAQWIQGYLSALNALNANGPNAIEVEWVRIDDWVRKWCVVNPDRKLEEAVGAFAIAHVNKD